MISHPSGLSDVFKEIFFTTKVTRYYILFIFYKTVIAIENNYIYLCVHFLSESSTRMSFLLDKEPYLS